MPLAHELEALLFYRAEPTRITELAAMASKPLPEVEAALADLRETLRTRGVRLVRVHDTVELVTAPEAQALIEQLRQNELKRDLGKAGSETLALVLYRGEATRAEIDHVRGVNSTFILRNLLIRGLIERVESSRAVRGGVYRPTTALLAHLGLTALDELPEYVAVRAQLASFDTRDAGTTFEHSVP